jgi:hypothetical protein
MLATHLHLVPRYVSVELYLQALRLSGTVFEHGNLSFVKVGFEVLTAVSTKMAVFWVVAPCSLVEVYQRFRGPSPW